METPPVTALQVVWFRDDLRVTDHPALFAAMQNQAEHVHTVAIYLLDEESDGIRPLGAAAKWWLHRGLEDLRQDLSLVGVPLILRRGPGAESVPRLADELCGRFGLTPGGLSLFWNRRHGGGERAVDAAVEGALKGRGSTVTSYAGTLLHEPGTVQTKDRQPYKVFTPFHAALQRIPLRPQLPAPANPQRALPPAGVDTDTAGTAGAGSATVPSDDLDHWDLLPKSPDWSAGLAAAWTPGEAAAHDRLALVLEEIAADYPSGRDRPDTDCTSRLSPALRWGHLSPVQVWETLSAVAAQKPEAAEGARAIMRQLAWRDFCWNQLHHQPDLHTENLRREFDAFDWTWPTEFLPWPGGARQGTTRPDKTLSEDGRGAGQQLSDQAGTEPSTAQASVDVLFTAWCRGGTGFALVDAGMRQLWETGWMHNRVRMVTASLLVKNFGIHWRAGEAWFWDTLVDADAASNPANWQWVAGCGADAAPYFRVFNPVLQAKKFDPRGTYVARFAPSGLEPLVDLKESRNAALAAHAHMKQAAREDAGEAQP